MRKLAWFAGAFSLGIFLSQYLLPGGWLLPGALVCLGLGCLSLLLPYEWRRRGVVAGAALALALGYNWLYVHQVQQPMEALADTDARVTMTFCDYAVSTDYGAKVTVRIGGLPGKVVYYGDETLLVCSPGQTVTDDVHFMSASCIRDDDVTAFTSKGIFLLAYQRGEAGIGKGSMDSPRWWPVRLGRAMHQQISTLFEGDTAGFLTAILTGDKSGLSEEASADLSEAGLYHILAVSGMHCGFLLAMVIFLLGRHRRRLVAACAIPLLIFYALLTGGSLSVVRACVMLVFLLAAPLFRRDSDGVTSLTAALFLILLHNPFAAASISLQLSFTALAGMLFLTPRLTRLLSGGKERGRAAIFLISGFSATMGALIFTVPVSAVYFGTLVLISPLSNLLCLWAASVVFATGLLAVLLSFFLPPLGMVFVYLPKVFAGYILTAAGLLAKIPYHAVYFANPYLKYWLGFTYFIFAAAWLGKQRSGRKYAVAATAAVLTLALTVFLGIRRYDSALDTVVLDVGQGQSVVLASEGCFALVDCGSGSSWYGSGEEAAHQLLTMGCRKLDYLILTHFDDDHINGLDALLARMEIETILAPEERYAAIAVGEETQLSLGAARLTIYPPIGNQDDNERGLSVLASAGEQDLLITGDMSSATERKLLEAFSLPDIEALVAGHHGSKTSTSVDLLETLKPETVCISVGSNSYGHPAPEMLWRLKEHDCTVYRTDLHGNIHLSFD